MIVLGIETSCDETSCAVVKDGFRVLSNSVSSSLEFHKRYGGVIPEIASRKQLETISCVAENAINKSGKKLKDIDLISVTQGPGLLGSLLVGISFGKALALSLNKPILGVNHVLSHFYANFLTGEKIKTPFIALVVSGGHTNLYYVRDFDKIETLGQTQDDACGEAFDKVAKILKLGYPGGPAIEKIAKSGNTRGIKFRCSCTKNELDFSFSGIKTAVLYYSRDNLIYRRSAKISDIAASFQETVVNTLISKAISACESKQSNKIVIGGGVAANNRLREQFKRATAQEGITCYFPPLNLCMDNAAMIAGLGFQLYKKGYRSDLSLTADLN